MNSNNSSINRTINNQQLAPGAPTLSHHQQQQQQLFSQYGNSINNNYSNQNNLNHNFTNMVAAGQQGMDVGYNTQVRS
jgi:hypothetical protein